MNCKIITGVVSAFCMISKKLIEKDMKGIGLWPTFRPYSWVFDCVSRDGLRLFPRSIDDSLASRRRSSTRAEVPVVLATRVRQFGGEGQVVPYCPRDFTCYSPEGRVPLLFRT
jgi:hypothetical protein